MEEVILVDEYDSEVGLMVNWEAHSRGVVSQPFSVFTFNNRHVLLFQSRALSKYQNSCLLTNAYCNHPNAQEYIVLATGRQLKGKMDVDAPSHKAFHVTQKAAFENGLVDQVFNDAFVAYYNDVIHAMLEDVWDQGFVSDVEIDQWLQQHPHQYSLVSHCNCVHRGMVCTATTKALVA